MIIYLNLFPILIQIKLYLINENNKSVRVPAHFYTINRKNIFLRMVYA
jgi:hypothetical protein